MEIVKREYKTYNFDELSQNAKEKAVEHFKDINVDYDGWHEFITEDFKQNMASLGYTIDNVYFSGFWSQGDGASFTGSIDVEEWLKIKKLKSKYRKLLKREPYLKFVVTQRGNYYHEQTMNIEYDGYYDDDEINQLLDDVLAEARTKAKELYRTLEKEYDYQTGSEAVIETIEANEYKFLVDGELFNY